MNKALSDSDISRYVKTVLLYSQLSTLSAKKLLSLLPAAILYQIKPNYGHWVLLHKTVEGIEFFDPYGIVVDKEFEHLPLKQPHYLAKLLLQIQKYIPINYSPYQFQKVSPKINTCGRWTVLRSMYPYWSIDKFARRISSCAKEKGMTPDEYVTWATKNIF